MLLFLGCVWFFFSRLSEFRVKGDVKLPWWPSLACYQIGDCGGGSREDLAILLSGWRTGAGRALRADSGTERSSMFAVHCEVLPKSLSLWLSMEMGTGVCWFNFSPQFIFTSVSSLSRMFSKNSVTVPKVVKCAFFSTLTFLFPLHCTKTDCEWRRGGGTPPCWEDRGWWPHLCD